MDCCDPTRDWHFKVDSDRHFVSYTPRLSTDRPDTIIVDGYLCEIAWRRVTRSKSANPRREAYRASLEIGGHPAQIEWITSDQPIPLTTGELGIRAAVDMATALINPGSSSHLVAAAQYGGRVNLIVDDHIVGEREGDVIDDTWTLSGATDAPAGGLAEWLSDNAWTVLVLAVACIEIAVLALVFVNPMHARLIPFEALTVLAFGLPALATLIIGRVLRVNGIRSLLGAYLVIVGCVVVAAIYTFILSI